MWRLFFGKISSNKMKTAEHLNHILFIGIRKLWNSNVGVNTDLLKSVTTSQSPVVTEIMETTETLTSSTGDQ